MSEDMPDRMSEDMPDRMPDRMSNRMPDRMLEDLPRQNVRWDELNAMVGITRSTVILKLFFLFLALVIFFSWTSLCKTASKSYIFLLYSCCHSVRARVSV